MLLSQEEVIWGYTSLGWVVPTHLPSAHTLTHQHLSDTLPLILAPPSPTVLPLSFFLSLYVRQKLQIPELWKLHYIISSYFFFAHWLKLRRHLSGFLLFILPPSIHPPSSLVFPPLPPSTGGDKSHWQGRREIIQHQLVTNRMEEIWQLS